jgi:Domain of unknown function (DUF5710)
MPNQPQTYQPSGGKERGPRPLPADAKRVRVIVELPVGPNVQTKELVAYLEEVIRHNVPLNYDPRRTPVYRSRVKIKDFARVLGRLTAQSPLRSLLEEAQQETQRTGSLIERSTRGDGEPIDGTPISVPYSPDNNATAKRHGARWDPTRNSWVAPRGCDLTPFQKLGWLV